MLPDPLARDALPVATIALARHLLGRLVVRVDPDGVRIGRIVETEAYPPGDPALHAYRGMTPRNRALFLPPGHAYVYLCYGTSFMLNVSSEAEGIGAGVLLRALEPLEGIAAMQAARGGGRLRDLARGPGRLAAALAIDRSLDSGDLCARGPLYLAEDAAPRGAIRRTTRIGLTKAAERRLRFVLRASPFASGPAALNR
ncbi:MAG: DNA-3-methyladenine glycosylase [Rhodospirillales bacterium]|nr:DNA-3-methyladenine glycosylase [Rhodospirillales bacterium]